MSGCVLHKSRKLPPGQNSRQVVLKKIFLLRLSGRLQNSSSNFLIAMRKKKTNIQTVYVCVLSVSVEKSTPIG